MEELVTVNQTAIENGIKFLNNYLEEPSCSRGTYKQAVTCLNILYRARIQEVSIRQLNHATHLLSYLRRMIRADAKNYKVEEVQYE